MKTNINSIRNGVIIFLSLGIFLVSPVALAQEQFQVYSGFNRFIDNIGLFFSVGDSKVRLALEIREKEVNSALKNAEDGNLENAIKNLEKAQAKLKFIQEKISLKNSEEIKESIEEIKDKISKSNLPEEFKKYGLEEEKTQLIAELTLKTFEYCNALAQEDYSLMSKEEQCSPETALKGMENELKELKQAQEKSLNELTLDIRSCIDNPETCNCSNTTNISQKTNCEKMMALAVKCKYKDEKAACEELRSIDPVKGDSFTEKFVPNFLTGLFGKEQGIVDYDIEKSDVPEECYDGNEGDKSECGNTEENVPTMQESIPQCYDGSGQFLTDKCGKVIMVRNEQGLINYISEGQLDNIIENFENVSEQEKIETDGKKGRTMFNEVKEEINQITDQIANITYAEGTGPGEESGVVIEGDKEGVVTGNGGNSTGGLVPEIKTSTAGDGTTKNDPLPEPDLYQINPDLYNPNARAPGDTIDETYDDEPPPEGTNIKAP